MCGIPLWYRHLLVHLLFHDVTPLYPLHFGEIIFPLVLVSFTEVQCPGDKVFTSCGTACPRTCENKDELIFCTLQCVRKHSNYICISCIHMFVPLHAHVHFDDPSLQLGNVWTTMCGCVPFSISLSTFFYFSSPLPPSLSLPLPSSLFLSPPHPLLSPPTPSHPYSFSLSPEGCQCPFGTVALGDRCVAEEECPSFSHCLEPITPGLCRAYIPSYGYNVTTGRCERFIYGGCGGNNNLFCTRDECENVCGEFLIIYSLKPTI